MKIYKRIAKRKRERGENKKFADSETAFFILTPTASAKSEIDKSFVKLISNSAVNYLRDIRIIRGKGE